MNIFHIYVSFFIYRKGDRESVYVLETQNVINSTNNKKRLEEISMFKVDIFFKDETMNLKDINLPQLPKCGDNLTVDDGDVYFVYKDCVLKIDSKTKTGYYQVYVASDWPDYRL